MLTPSFSRPLTFLAAAAVALGLAAAGCGGHSGPPPKDPDLPPDEGRVGQHPMIAFGPNTEGGIYLAGVPSYLPPNDLQYVVKAHVTPVGPDYVPKKMNDGLYTMQPDTFALDKMVSAQVLTFQGNLFVGDYQAGSKQLTHGMRVDIDSMLFPPRPLDRSAPHTPEPNFIAFGRVGALYMVHLITGAPDYNQILFGHVVTGVDDMALARSVTLVDKGKPNVVVQRVRTHDKLGLTTLDGKVVQVEIDKELACETGDEFNQDCPR
jgi:hypothetical protein